MVVVPSGYEVGELANKHFFASLCARPNLARREIERGATPLTDRGYLILKSIYVRCRETGYQVPTYTFEWKNRFKHLKYHLI